MSRPNEQSQEPPEIEKFCIAIAHAALGEISHRDEIEASLAEFEAHGYHVLQPVRRIWNGERDLISLSAGLNQPAAIMIRRILEHITQIEAERTEARENVNQLVTDIVMVAIGNLLLSDASDEKLLRLEAGGYHIRETVHHIWNGERDKATLLKGLEPHESELVQWILSLIVRAEAEFGSGSLENNGSNKEENGAEVYEAPQQGATDEKEHAQESHYPELKGNRAKPPSNGTVVTLLRTMILRTKRKLTSLLSRSSLMRRIILKRATTSNPYLVPVLTLLSMAQQLTSQARPNPQDALALIEACKQIIVHLPSGADPSLYAGIQFSLGSAYNVLFKLSVGDRASNLQQVITCFREALRILTPEMNPPLYATLQRDLGAAYGSWQMGDPTENLQQAITCFQEALRFLSPRNEPFDYALVQYDLGTAYLYLPGKQIDNLQRAISHLLEASRLFDSDIAPADVAGVERDLGDYYAGTQHNLGAAYLALSSSSDPITHLQRAITCFQEALRFWNPERDPFAYARAQHNLGNAYDDLSEVYTEDQVANFQRTITCYQEALHFWTPETAPLDYARVQCNLGTVYQKLRTGDPLANRQQALVCYQEALRFFSPEDTPFDYATVQNNLGILYDRLTIGERARNVQQAIDCFQKALHCWTPETTPHDYAMTQINLGNLFLELSTGDRANNLHQALTCYREALRFLTPETTPFDYAKTQSMLGAVFSSLTGASQVSNMQQAIAYCQEALRFLTAEAAPFEYARTQCILAQAYQQLPAGDRTNPVQQAIISYQEALHFFAPETAPFMSRGINQRLGNLYFSQGKWQDALTILITVYN